jgi:hypothetical protein
MSFLKLCKSDPLLSILKEHFDASLVRIPKSSVKPYLVLGYRDGKLNTLGQLEKLFVGELAERPKVRVEEVTEKIEGEKSGNMSSDFGIKILDGFLEGFNLPSAGFKSAFSKAKNMAYSFDKVRSEFIESLELGSLLGEMELDSSNLSLRPFIKDNKNRLFVVVRTYQSKSFNIHFDKSFESNLNAEIQGLKELIDLDESSFSVNKEEKGGVNFEGKKYKTFAFQLVELEVDEDGMYIKEIVADNDHKVLRENNQLHIAQLSEEPAMFDLALEVNETTEL